MNIYPKIGVDAIKFGMSQQQIQAELGAPVAKEKTEIEEIFEYANGVELVFEDNQLCSITLADTELRLHNKAIIGITEAALQAQFPAFTLDEDYGVDGKSYYDAEQEIMAWVFDGEVFNIVLFPAYKEESD